MEENPRDQHNLLSETLWAYRTSKKDATRVSPFPLTYGHDAVLPVEVLMPSLKVSLQNNLIPKDYSQAMTSEMEELDQAKMDACDRMILQKKKISKV